MLTFANAIYYARALEQRQPGFTEEGRKDDAYLTSLGRYIITLRRLQPMPPRFFETLSPQPGQ